MKITNAEVIKSGEKDLIDSITADLDWEAIENIFLTEHNLGIDEDIEYKRGDIIAYNNQVAYKLEFTVKVNLSVLINREGEYLSVKISGKGDDMESMVDHEDTDGTGAEGGDDIDMMGQEEARSAGNGSPSGDADEKAHREDVADVNEDKYMRALEQLDSDDPGEGPGEAIG